MACVYLAIAGFLAALVVPLTRIARRRLNQPRVLDGGVCPCGYPLKKLGLPRCPECGRVVGFDASADVLGLTDAELERLAARRREREEFLS